MPHSRWLRAVHVTGRLRSLGGVQSVVRRHLEKDPLAGIESSAIILFERNDPEPGRVGALGWNWRSSIRAMRQSFAREANRWPNRIFIYHDLWGLPFLSDLDGASRRIGFLHTNPPGMEKVLRAQKGLVDGLIAISRPLAELAARTLPELTAGRICLAPLPVDPLTASRPHLPMAGRPIKLGYCGRLEIIQKRIDRLLLLAAQLKELGVPFEFELLGSGPKAGWLKRQFAGQDNVRQLGSKSGQAYWNVLSGWDLMVNVSDFEGTPISMLEGLSVGVPCLFPQIASDGIEYSRQAHPSLVYPAGDMAAAARAIQTVTQLSQEQWSECRARSVGALKGHLGNAYHDMVAPFLANMTELPRISSSQGTGRSYFVADHLPLGFMSRFAPACLLQH